jgi:hypothetical protein
MRLTGWWQNSAMRTQRIGKILTIGAVAAAFVLLIGGVFTYGYISANNPWQVAANDLSAAKLKANPAPGDIKVYDLWISVNRIREQNKVPPLMLDPGLNKAAAAKCADMVNAKYWSHKDPKGADPWHFIKEAGVPYTYAAENIAKDYTKPAAIFNAWSHSQDEKAKMIDAHYTRAGYAVCKTTSAFQGSAGPTLLIVQMLAG